jgi:murein DD-endopeptidase MepM/ murein hydrolase activator NlpD
MKRNFESLKNRLSIKGAGKMLVLLAGVGLCGMVVLEASQQMVKAFDLKNISVQSNPQSSVQSVPPISTVPKAQTRSPQAGAARSKPSQSLDFGIEQPAAQPKTLALNSGSANDPQQPVSQASASQIATAGSGWTGASFPVEGFQAYTSPFGYRQSPDGSYSQEFHYGLDMAAPEGSYVRNWWGGKVVEVTDNTNCGTSVVLESGNWTHIYCHMEGHVEEGANGRFMIDREGGIQIYVGQEVPAGSRIGRVGMSGRTTGPHLHWGLKFNGNWVDPAYVLQAMYAGQQSTTARAGGDRAQ